MTYRSDDAKLRRQQVRELDRIKRELAALYQSDADRDDYASNRDAINDLRRRRDHLERLLSR